MLRPIFSIIVLLAVQMALWAKPVQDTQDGSDPASNPGEPIIKRTTQSGTGMMPMPLVAPLFIQDANTESEITMVNNSSKALDVEITLTNLSGTQISQTTVEMAPYGQKVQKLSDLLATVPPGLPANVGSVLLVANRNASLAAQLSIVYRGPYQTNDIEEEFAMMADPKPTEYRGVVGSIAGSPVVAIRSLSAAIQTLSVTCLGDKGTGPIEGHLQITPNQTLLIQACRPSGATEVKGLSDIFNTDSEQQKGAAISVSSSAPSMDIAVFGIGIRGNGSHRMATAMPFSDINTLHSSTAVYPGITAEYSAFKERNFRLQIALANFGSSPKSATVWLSSGGGSDSTREAIATATVPPGSVSIAESRAISPDPFGRNSIVVRADGYPGDLVSAIQLSSRSGIEQTNIALPWKDQAQVENGGEHPWTVSGTLSSDLLLFNSDAAAKNDSVQVSVHAGEQLWIKAISIEPLATVRISLRDIIQNQQLDDKGRSLPKDSWQGVVTWSTGLKPRIFGKLVQTDEYRNISRAYACGSIVSACAVVLTNATPNPIAVGEQTSVEVAEVEGCTGDSPCSCNDGCGSASTSGAIGWGEDNSSIVTLAAGYSGSANYLGKGSGQTFIDANVFDSQGCFGSGGTSITVTNNKCFAQLKYRSADSSFGIPSGFNHSFWWFQDSSNTHWVTDGGPSSSPCPGNCGYLHAWVALGDSGHYSADNYTQPTAWASPVSGSVCSNVYTLYAYALGWPQTGTTYYGISGPNSNTFAHDDGNAAGFNATAPPRVPGW